MKFLGAGSVALAAAVVAGLTTYAHERALRADERAEHPLEHRVLSHKTQKGES